MLTGLLGNVNQHKVMLDVATSRGFGHRVLRNEELSNSDFLSLKVEFHGCRAMILEQSNRSAGAKLQCHFMPMKS